LYGYLQRAPLPADWSRLQVLAALYDFLCLQWGQLYLNQRPDGADPELLERIERLAARLAASSVVE